MQETQTQIPLPPPIQCEPDPLIVQALLDAKAALWRGGPGTLPLPIRRKYICLAAEAVGPATAHMERAIARRLNATRQPEDWASEPNFDTWVDARKEDATDQERQGARLRWIDQLVVEFGGQP